MTHDEFKAARKTLGLTQGQLAELFGVTLHTVQRWEMSSDKKSSIALHPTAATAMRWLLDGFRPPEWPKG